MGRISIFCLHCFLHIIKQLCIYIYTFIVWICSFSSKVENMMDIVTGNPLVVKMIVRFNRYILHLFFFSIVVLSYVAVLWCVLSYVTVLWCVLSYVTVLWCVVVVVSTPSRAWARTGSQTPVRGPPSFSPHMSSSAATPTGSVHRSQTVSVVGMSGQLKRCNESWFGSLQSGQFAAGWLAGSILCR